ncbi:GNAT family N-acetyltransferase [Vulgatibacter incomptus]|uniref:N-acetyltransferase domain-containing protein n=1 Tax=Vulgatibacter incomptus TaxID=1391653 RepID=A0A0K1PDY5_9BACT|nr:GNAT family N-acetyltransferase [Vulgatibacter incomptus]AKU91720.1 hypothetical protein AKJ08_2107 [Vulgatibacter incomptus]
MTLAIATDAQKKQRDRLTHAAWGQRLSLAEFRSREEQLRDHPWAREAMTTWFSIDEHGEPLASCETFRMRSVRQVDGGHIEGSTYAIASVYTEEALRGRGHARAMIEEVCTALQAKDPQAQSAILFSEVGASLYRRAGFRERPWRERLFAAEKGELPNGVALLGEAELAQALDALPLPDEPFVVWPTALQLDWHLERERAYARLMDRQRPKAVGATCGDATLLWAGDLKNGRLSVLVGCSPDPDDSKRLIRAAAAVAWNAGLNAVHVWEMPSIHLAGGEGFALDADDLPMVRPFTPDLAAQDWKSIPRALWV